VAFSQSSLLRVQRQQTLGHQPTPPLKISVSELPESERDDAEVTYKSWQEDANLTPINALF
jgi:hypothetical protein